MAVRGAQLDALEPRGLAILDDGVDVPVLSELVGDKSQLEWRRRGRGSRAVRRGRAFSRRWARAAGCGLRPETDAGKRQARLLQKRTPSAIVHAFFFHFGLLLLVGASRDG